MAYCMQLLYISSFSLQKLYRLFSLLSLSFSCSIPLPLWLPTDFSTSRMVSLFHSFENERVHRFSSTQRAVEHRVFCFSVRVLFLCLTCDLKSWTVCFWGNRILEAFVWGACRTLCWFQEIPIDPFSSSEWQAMCTFTAQGRYTVNTQLWKKIWTDGVRDS